MNINGSNYDVQSKYSSSKYGDRYDSANIEDRAAENDRYMSTFIRALRNFFWNLWARCVEFFGLSVFFLALASIVALVSYCSEDPSLNTAIDGAVSNLMSLPGSYYADFMVQIFGGGAYVFHLFCFLGGISL